MNDKERLENMSPIGFDLNGNVLLKGEDYHWLMEQAERVEELELEVNDLRAEVQKWQKFHEESEDSEKNESNDVNKQKGKQRKDKKDVIDAWRAVIES